LARELHKLKFKSTLSGQQSVVLDSIIYYTNTADVMNHYLLIGYHSKIQIWPSFQTGSQAFEGKTFCNSGTSRENTLSFQQTVGLMV